MPVELDFEVPSLFTLRAYGAVTDEEVLAAVDDLLADARLREGARLFIDNRGVTSTPSPGEIAVITDRFAEAFRRGLRRVALFSDNDQVHEMAHLFSSFASTVGAEAKAFRDERGAREWLGQSDEPQQ